MYTCDVSVDYSILSSLEVKRFAGQVDKRNFVDTHDSKIFSNVVVVLATIVLLLLSIGPLL